FETVGNVSLSNSRCKRRTIRKRLKKQKKKGGKLPVDLVKLAKTAISPVLEKAWLSLKWLLRILSFLMRCSKVEGGTRSLAVAPFGPDTRPRLPASASSTICRSRVASSSTYAGSGCCGKLTRRESLDNQAASTENTPSELTMTDLSTTFCSSRILPGQG